MAAEQRDTSTAADGDDETSAKTAVTSEWPECDVEASCRAEPDGRESERRLTDELRQVRIHNERAATSASRHNSCRVLPRRRASDDVVNAAARTNQDHSRRTLQKSATATSSDLCYENFDLRSGNLDTISYAIISLRRILCHRSATRSKNVSK